MGGKHKQAQRTKNNARPSSSSRSAEILGNLVPSFVGFSTSKEGELVPILPGFSSKEEIDPNIDPTFQLVLKKFGKKDSTTKLKALNEFTTLVSSSEESVVCAALSLWPRYYSQLSTDVEHRIREAAQVAHGAVAQKCGRSIAPYLKQLAPVWITAQYDTYVPAALQAQAALQTVFPAAKLPEVLSFCRTEILSYITNNLVYQTPTTLSNPKTNTPEECEAKYERVVIASLQGYALLINNLPDVHTEWLCEEQLKILDCAKFWSYGTHKSPQVRTSCYMVIGCLCQRFSSWFGPKYGAKASQLLLTQLNEKELNVTISVWENAIILMANIPEWWKLVKLDECVLPAVCETLSAGGWGSAGRMAPLLLPLLAHLSTCTLTQQFYDAFFEAILKGAEQRCVVSSKSECSAWMSGLAECLRYVSMGATDSLRDYTTQSLSRALRLWLALIARSHISINPLAPLKVSIGFMCDLIKFWIKQSLTSQNQPFFSQLVRLFWKNVLFIVTSQVEKAVPDDDVKEMTDIHRELLSGLKHSLHVKSCKKKTIRVKFDSDQDQSDNSEIRSASDQSESEQSNDTNIKQTYERELFSVVNDVCTLYLEWAISKNVSAPILGPLYSLVLEFDTPQLFITMLHSVSKEKTDTKIINLYSDLFLNWLKGDSMRSQAVVDLTFALFNNLSDGEQRELLKTFDQLPLSTIKWCISRCLSYPHSSRPSVREWLQGDLVHQSIISMSHLVVKEGDRHHATLLKMCFAQDNNGGILINDKTCSSIISILSESLSRHESIHLDMCASFASQLAASLCTDDKKYQGVEELLLSLFILNCNIQGGSEVLSGDTWWEVNTSWQDALSTFSWEKLVDFAEKAADVVFNKLVKSESKIDNESLNILVNMSFNLICSCVDTSNLVSCDLNKLCKVLEIIMKVESTELQTWFADIYCKAVIADVLNGRLDAPFAGDLTTLKTIIESSNNKSYNELPDNELQNILKWLLFCTKLMDKVLVNTEKNNNENQNNASDDEEELEELEQQSFLDNDVGSNDIKNILSCVFYNISVIKTLYDEYQAWHWHLMLTEYYKLIEVTASHALKSLTNENYLNFLSFLKNKADQEGMYWSICLELCASSLRESEKSFNLNLYLKNSFQVMHKMQDMQSVCEYTNKHLSHSMHIIRQDTASSRDSSLNLTGMLALRYLYLCSSNNKALANIKITKEEFDNCFASPILCLSFIIEKYYHCKPIMLYDIKFTSANWELVSCNAAIVRFLTACVQTLGWELEAHHWDFITITLSSLMQSLDKSKDAWNTTKVSLLACETFKLFCAVDTFIHNIPSECQRREPTPSITNLPQEWVDIFTPDIHQHLIKMFIYVLGQCTDSEKVTSKDLFFFHSLSDIMQLFKMKYLTSNVAEFVQSSLEVCLDILGASSIHVLKYIAHHMLNKLTPVLMETDKTAANSTFTEEEDKPEPIQLSVHSMAATLVHLQECVDAVLSPYGVGEGNCVLDPFTDSFNITLGYLLLWETMLNISQDSVTFLQYKYTEFFREGKHAEHLVCSLFRLIPEESQQTTNSVNYFKNPPELLTRVRPHKELVSWQARACLVQSLRAGAVPGAARGWWGALPSRTAQYVERVVRTSVAPILISQQLTEVARRQKELPNVEFSIHPSVNEVFCKYIIDQTKMELTIELCSNHPLGIPRVVSSGGPSNNVAWITMFLSHQNGTLWQTVTLWVNSIQRKLDSVPECYVCYCKLHPVTGKLPKITCHTCKNKSHHVCLKKWFSTSGNTTCPMCRSHMTLKI